VFPSVRRHVASVKPRTDMQLVAVQLVACLGELYCLGNKLLKVEHVEHCATCRQVRLFVAQTGNLLRRQVAHSVQTCNLLPATSCMSGRGLRLTRRLAEAGVELYIVRSMADDAACSSESTLSRCRPFCRLSARRSSLQLPSPAV